MFFPPIHATEDGPCEDSGEVFGFGQAIAESRVAVGFGDGDGERDFEDAAPDGVVGAPDFGAVVGDEGDFALGLEGGFSLVQLAGGDEIAAGQGFERRFVQAAAGACFDGGDEARAL